MKVSDKHFQECLARLSETEEGKVFLAYLCQACSWDITYLASDSPEVTQYHAARRGVWGGLRRLFKPAVLKQVEFDYQFEQPEAGTYDRTDPRSATRR